MTGSAVEAIATACSKPAVLAAAESYLGRGWMPIPLPYRSKKITETGWQEWRFTFEQLDEVFSEGEKNIGVLTGNPSNWLIDVDLDHRRAVELADEYLPPTNLVFGRAGKPRSHRLYRITRPASTKKFRSKSEGMIVEFRSTGCQTVFPPSVHECGEPIQWEDPTAEPAEVDPDTLLDAVAALADQVKTELGERAAPKLPAVTSALPDKNEPEGDPHADLPETDRKTRCLKAMRQIGLRDGKDGSFRLFAAACRCVEHDLSDSQAIECIRNYVQVRPFPRQYSDEEILKRLRDAERRCERGKALEVDEDGLTALGNRDPQTGKIVLSSRRTVPTAEAFVREFHTHPEGPTLWTYAGIAMEWQSNRYRILEDASIKRTLQPWLHGALRYHYDARTGTLHLVPFESNPGTVTSAMETIRTYTHLPVETAPPAWLDDAGDRPDPTEILSCRSMNLHIPTGQVMEATPALFTTSSLDFNYSADAAAPLGWLQFLGQLWGGDAESANLLQEWFGYCLTPDTRQQKMLLIVGPRRSGKGTIAKVLRQLVGPANVVGPTTSSLAGNFGLQPLIGRSLAVVSDARFAGDGIQTVVERLLCISGEDVLTIDRKHIESVTMKLPTRFMFLTNEIPRFTDASGALPGRFLVLEMKESFFGREDHGLAERLLAELPGILLWSLQGWQRLRDRGFFLQPASADLARQELDDLASPIRVFVQDWCVMGPNALVERSKLYEAWKIYCLEKGLQAGAQPTFGKKLLACYPVLRASQRRVDHERPHVYVGIGLSKAVPGIRHLFDKAVPSCP